MYFIVGENRYKAKNFTDTVIYSSVDQLASWSSVGLTAISLGIFGTACIADPFSVVWLVLSFWLGWQQVKRVSVEDAKKALLNNE